MFKIAIVKPSHAVNVLRNIARDRFLAFSSSVSSICSAAPIFRKMNVSARVATPEKILPANVYIVACVLKCFYLMQRHYFYSQYLNFGKFFKRAFYLVPCREALLRSNV